MEHEKKIDFSPFHYDDISLRLLQSEDLPHTLKWRNEYRQWFNTDEFLSLETHLNWFKHYQTNSSDYVFIIRNQKGERVGQAAVYNIDWEKKEGEFGRFLVNPDFSGKSYMKKSAAAMIELCKRKLQLKRLFLEVKASNEKAIHIYQSIGFTFIKKNKNNNFLMSYM